MLVSIVHPYLAIIKSLQMEEHIQEYDRFIFRLAETGQIQIEISKIKQLKDTQSAPLSYENTIPS